MYKYIGLLLVFSIISCKTKQKTVATEPVKTDVSSITIANIIQNHYQVKRDFTTAYIKADIDYKDDKQSLGLSADIRIKKGEIILVSVKMIGITVAKAIITPTQVRYYEKLNSKYFEGDYKTLSNWLGTDLDFKKIENMLLGQAIDDLTLGKYTLKTDENGVNLEDIANLNFTKKWLFDGTNFTLKNQEIIQKTPQRKLLVNYLNYKFFPESVIPGELLILANQAEKATTIGIEYKNCTFNQELTFPYSVPSGYQQIKM